MTLDPANVTACLVTRGDVDMQPIIDTLPYGEIIVWDNSRQQDFKVWGRYRAAADATNEIIYWQDDDVIFTGHDELLAAWEPDTFVANNAHGPNPGGYEDLALQAAGALCPGPLIVETWKRWYHHHPISYPHMFHSKLVADATGRVIDTFGDAVLLEADFIFGTLCPRWKQIDLPYERLYADSPTRLCAQPWQEDLKLLVTTWARMIRDNDRSAT